MIHYGFAPADGGQRATWWQGMVTRLRNRMRTCRRCARIFDTNRQRAMCPHASFVHTPVDDCRDKSPCCGVRSFVELRTATHRHLRCHLCGGRWKASIA